MLLALAFACLPALAAVHPVPKDRAALTSRDSLPHVVSKIAPLEWWSVASSLSDLRREDFSSDYEYEQAKLDTAFPRFCFSLFRPKPEEMSSLIAAVNGYKGDVIWAMGESCIYAMPFKTTFVTSETGFVNRAMLDAPRLSAYLEERLGLAGKPSLDFDPQWLTRDGLAASRGQLEEFWEPGSWTVFLARKPQEYARTASPTSTTDRPLAMGIAAYELDALFDPLDADWESRPGDGTAGPVIPAYPLLSRISDLTADALYERQEVAALLDECLQMQANTSNPIALRGLDNLIRIARWAQKLKVGIYFGAQNP
ncbi:MAG: hypothetical protein JWM83_56 [Candidatus Angelobacter sp.]|nr:hypothetical protein [Candidatus Angelobacter sp.]